MSSKKSRRVKGSSPYTPAKSDLLFLDRQGSENEADPRYLQKLRHYFKDMSMMEESSLPIHRDLYGGLEKAIVDSTFWNEDNEFSDYEPIKEFGPANQTDATRALSDSLREFFRDRSIPVSVVAISVEPDDVSDPKKSKQTNENPNQFVVGAQAGVSSSGNLQLFLLAIQSEEDFDSSRVDPQVMAVDISTKIRHEFVHSKQYDSLAKAKGISRVEAKNQYEKWGLIPADGSSRSEYLGSHIEIDAFGHEFAELLAQKFGLDRADSLVASSDHSELQKISQEIDSSGNMAEYYVDYSDEIFTSKLQKKIRKYLKLFRKNKIYERRLMEAVVDRLIVFCGDK